ncbi:hypothetical protein ACIGJK_07435 [Pseudomonas iridis]|uniref:hypothetical protein n=1 Tax=Pseudomonas iridis TaxID=2710587 RepID=UPI0037C714DB
MDEEPTKRDGAYYDHAGGRHAFKIDAEIENVKEVNRREGRGKNSQISEDKFFYTVFCFILIWFGLYSYFFLFVERHWYGFYGAFAFITMSYVFYKIANLLPSARAKVYKYIILSFLGMIPVTIFFHDFVKMAVTLFFTGMPNTNF